MSVHVFNCRKGGGFAIEGSSTVRARSTPAWTSAVILWALFVGRRDSPSSWKWFGRRTILNSFRDYSPLSRRHPQSERKKGTQSSAIKRSNRHYTDKRDRRCADSSVHGAAALNRPRRFTAAWPSVTDSIDCPNSFMNGVFPAFDRLVNAMASYFQFLGAPRFGRR
jgi:hypothetical protein